MRAIELSMEGRTKVWDNIQSMAIRVVEFHSGGTIFERLLPKNQHTQRKLLNFENWVNGEVSKIGIILESKVI
jgi:hypothetical protein